MILNKIKEKEFEIVKPGIVKHHAVKFNLLRVMILVDLSAIALLNSLGNLLRPGKFGVRDLVGAIDNLSNLLVIIESS